ncbi:MAG: hypothetical protein ISS34_05765 [Candidatus Omnitrophica bacterium]|nr:hypothetical protein [Candidatus Omnitrophota bacterium]
MRKFISTISIAVVILFIGREACFANEAPLTGSFNATDSKSSSRAGEEILFTTTYEDPDGIADLKHCFLAFYPTINTDNTRRVWVFYKCQTNQLYLLNPDTGRYKGGYAPGSNRTIKVSTAILDCAKTSVVDADKRVITWALTFREPLANEKFDIYQTVRDLSNVVTKYVNKGTWEVRENIIPIIRFQGKLEGADEARQYTLTFRLYDIEAGGIPLWEEGQTKDITNGLLDVELGSVTPLDIPFDKQYWLGVEVEFDGEMLPRFKLTPVPYSIRSGE